jgi:hypothetical protein
MIDRRLAKALVFLQACMIPVATLIAWVLKDIVVAKSAPWADWFAGWHIVILPGNLFGLQERVLQSKCFQTCIEA